MSKTSHTERGMTRKPCWKCHVAAKDPYFCTSCNALQSLPEEVDCFRCLDLDYRLDIDLKLLEETFHTFSRKFHPDFYQNRSEEEKRISLSNAAILNKAYKTLKDPIKRMTYLITLAEGEGEVSAEAPEDLFEEIFTLQEALDAARTQSSNQIDNKPSPSQELETALKKFQQRLEQGNQKLSALSLKWDRLEPSCLDSGFTDRQSKCLKEMKEILSHRTYLERIIREIHTTIEGG